MKKSDGLVPAIIQNVENGAVLMLGYMNKASLKKTLATKKVWFYSRSKKRLWMKGEVSKNVLKFVNAKIDCDGDTILIQAIPTGPVCHTGETTCFGDTVSENVLVELYNIIKNRRKMMPKKSYTTSLFREGLDKICAKVAEESAEVLYAARKQSKKRLVEESVDLIYHLFVLLNEKNIDLTDVTKEIKRRRK